jgi:hypothetical protein
MATLEQAGQLVTKKLRERVDRLVSAVEGEAPDFAEIVRLADAVGEQADTIADVYTELEQILSRGLHGGSDSHRDEDESQEKRRDEQRRQRSEQNGSTVEDVTKEELLDRAREVNVHGRSSMSKEELAQAVEAEESLTKEELLERARNAGIEGRSAMTKDELRKALREADA